MTLTNTNSQFCKEITNVDTKLAAALEKIAKLQDAKSTHNSHYCCPCVSNSNHSSHQWKNKNQDRVDDATEQYNKHGTNKKFWNR